MASSVHPTYRCGICRSLLVMGEPHSHRKATALKALEIRTATEKRYARGTGYMG